MAATRFAETEATPKSRVSGSTEEMTPSVRASAKSMTSLDTLTPARGGRKSSFSYRSLMPERETCDITARYDMDKREIGAGGYGKVYVATDRDFGNKKVAIKKVSKNMCMANDSRMESLRKEVRIMQELDHPNICKLLETYETHQVMYFVMECCEGGEVFDRIMDTGQISEDQTSHIIRQVASALLYAHTRGIAHRDLKPENICFVDSDPNNTQVKVIDWGLGFYFGQGRMCSAVGSLTYAAPEVLEAGKKEYGSACDLWSVGVLAYVMLCGRPPFWGNHTEQLKKMKQEDFPMKGSPWDSISPDCKTFIKALLKRDPTRRLPIEQVLQHPWLQSSSQDRQSSFSEDQQRDVMRNLQQFKNNSVFFSMCITSVARQLDHSSLRDVHRVFAELDSNGDGVLSLKEVKDGFEKLYGANSPETQQVEEMFEKLDLDGSGTIDYTEFCAAGIGEQMTNQEHVLHAAFRAFDVSDDNGAITKDEIAKVLKKADVQKAWTPEVCDQVAQEIMDKFDDDHNGEITFDEWLRLMRDTSISVHKTRAADETLRDTRRNTEDLEAELERARQNGSIEQAYELLKRMNENSPSPITNKVPPAPVKQRTRIGQFTDRLARTITGGTRTPVCSLGEGCIVM